MTNSSCLTTFGRRCGKAWSLKLTFFGRYWWDEMPLYQQMNRFITLPFSEHTTIPGTLELLGALNTWLREILGANARLGPRPAPLSIEERNEDSVRLMEAADVPQYNWTMSATGEEITVMADR